jgi:hypothetical protein
MDIPNDSRRVGNEDIIRDGWHRPEIGFDCIRHD